MKNYFKLFSICFILIFSSCIKDLKTIKGLGPVVTTPRSINTFNEIELSINADVYLTLDTVSTMQIEAQSNIASNIKTDVSSGKLSICNYHNMRKYEPIKIYITTNNINSINVSGSGNIYINGKFASSDLTTKISGSGSILSNDSLSYVSNTNTINGSGDIELNIFCDKIHSTISGSGSIDISGECAAHEIDISGSGDINAYNLVSSSADIRISGSGTVYSTILNYFNVRISGSGDVHYKGNPTIDASISGSGKLIHEN